MFTRKYALCVGKLPAISRSSHATPAFRIGMPPLPAFFLLLLLLAGFVPPAAAQLTPTARLQPGGVLTMMEHAVPTEVYFDGRENDGLRRANSIAVSGDLLFVTAELDNALSVWRVNAEAGTLTQTDLHTGAPLGLLGVIDAVVSGDGTLLFVIGQSLNDALSVWRVNAEAGTLSLNVVYQNRMGGINGLLSASSVAISGNLLFVTASFDDTLSVWRVNAEAGTLTQTTLYQNRMTSSRIAEVDGRFDGLDGARNATVSGDGALLFVTARDDNALSVWRVNAEAGTLTQTALYQDSDVDEGDFNHIREVDGRFDGLSGANDLAVSGDGALLFVTARINNALSVWRVNAEAGTLSQTALYIDNLTAEDGGFEGLSVPWEAAVSGDGALLFVTASGDDALSVWRVNAEAGTLSQTAIYQDKDSSGGNFIDNVDGRVDGLEAATGVAVSGDLLFVTGRNDNALSAWQINNAEVSFGVPVMIRVQSDMPVDQEVTVTVTARSGAGSMAAQTVTLSPSTRSADAIFPLDFLRPGRWIFTAEAQPPVALDTSAARIAMQVLPPLLSLEARQERLALGSTVALTVRTTGWLEPASYAINAINTAVALEGSTPTVTVEYSTGTTEQEVTFPAQQIASPGQWEFSIRLPDNSPFRIGDGSTAIVEIVIPRLRLMPLPERLALGNTVTLTVRANVAVPVNTTYSITALRTTSAQTSFTITVEHPAGATEREVSFPAHLFSSTGQWEFSIQLPEDSPFQVGDGSIATVQIVIPRLQLVPLPELLALGSMVSLTVQAKVGVPTEATYNIIARHLVLATTAQVEVTHPAGVTEREVFFSPEQIASPGQWEFSIQLPEGSPFQVIANGTATVYVAPVLSLRLQGEAFSEGDSLTIEVRADSPPAMDAAVTITAQRRLDGVEVNAAEAVTLSPAPEVLSGQAEFSAGALGTGVWVFTAQSEPPQALYTANARAEAAVLPPPLRLEVSAPSTIIAGSTFGVTVRTATPVPAGTEVSVMVTFEGAAQTEILSAGETAATVAFTAPGTTGTFTVNATGTASVTDPNALAPTVTLSGTSVEVVPVPVMLTLFPASPLRVVANAQFSVEVGTNRPLPAGTEVNVQLQFNGASRPAVVSSTMPAPSVMFTAPPSGTLPLTASVVDITQSSPVVAVSAPASVAVQVTALLTIMLTVSAPPSVTVGNTFTVTVGVTEEPPLPAGASVTATVSSRAADGEEIRAETTVLSTMMPSDTLSLSAPVTAGTFSVTVSGQSEGTDDLLVMATGASASVTAVPVAVMLRLNGPAAVSVGQRYTVMVDTVMPVPKGTTLEVTVSAGTEPQEAFLTADNPSEELPFTAPLVAREVMLTAMTVMVQTAVDTLEVAVPDAVTLTVSVSALDVQLALSELPVDLVAASSNFPVTVGTEPALPEGAKVMVTVSLAAFSSEPMLLTSSTPMASVIVTAPTTGGAVTLRATGEAANDSTLNVLAATATVQVQAEDTVTLTLNAPRSVTVGSTFPVTVGVSATTPLAEGVSVTATVSFRIPNGEELQAETAVVTAAIPSDMRVFRAPVTADFYSVIVRGQVEETDDLRVRVNITSIRVIVVPVAVMLQLSAPSVVTVGQDYRVTVDTVMPVPEGTTLEVTVRAGTEPQEALFLTAGNPSEDIPFTAPRVASEVMFTAMTVMVQTAADALEVAVPDTVTLTVRVSAREVQLALSEVPVDLVPAASTFSVTVSAAPEMLAGTTVRVTVRLAAFTSEPVLLTPGAPTASVLVTAPAADGSETLLAIGEAAADSTLELNVLPAEAAVQVQVQEQEQVSLSLRLDAPPEVTARDSFAVTVFSEPRVPAGATVTVTVVFDGTDSSPVVLSAEMSSTAVMFTAPSRIENNLALMTSSVVTVADPSALQVTVADTATTVNSVQQSVQLVLLAPAAVNAGEEFPVVVSVSPALLADSTLTVAVVFGAVSTQQVTLTDTTPSQEVIFRAPDSDRPEVKTQVLAVAPADLVTVENATVQTVLVLVANAVELTLNAPGIVTVGSTFPVTVGVAAGISLMGAVVTSVSFNAPDSKAIEVTLSGEQSTATVQFAAPVTAGIFTVEVRDSPTAIGTAASVTVEPVAIMLRLNGPRTVTVSESYGVTVNTDVAIPEGTVVTVRQASAVGSLLTTLSDSSLTADNPSAQGFFMAPERAGEVRHILGVTRVRTRAGSLQVRVANAREIRVIVEAVSRRLQLRLEAPPEVTARDSFEVTVFAEPEVPAGTTVTVTVRFEEDETDRASVEMTPGVSMAVISVTAPDRLVADLKLMASGEAADADPGVQQVTVAAASATMNIVAQLVQLMLMAPAAVDAGAEFSVMVSVSPALLADTTLTVKVFFGEASSRQVTLSDKVSSQEVSFQTSATGTLEVSAQAVEVEPDGLVVAAAALTQTVQVKEAVNLTLNAPESVTVGSTFPVTVGVAEETPLPESTAVTATLSFGAADSATIIKEIDVTLTGEQSTTTEQFMAPVMAGIFRVEVNSPAEVGGRAVVGASAPVTVLPVAVILQLNGPETVAVGQTYTVTVDTNMPVPAGTTLEVTVSAGTEPKEVSLTAANPSEEVSFTAPLNVGEVMVTATVEVRTAPDAREVAVAAAATQTVQTVLVPVADAVELTLNAPGIVTVGSTFPVTVGVAAGISLMGAVVTSVSFNAPDSKAIEVTLSGENSTATVQFTAPVTAGIFTVEVRDSPTAIGTAASVTVEPVAIMLRLRAPQVVTVGKSYGVTVDTDVAIPEGTVVTVEMLTREGDTRMFSASRLLAADAPSTEYFFIALERAGEVFHTGLVEKVETRAGFLQVRVADAREIRVTVERAAVNLTLNTPKSVTVRSTFPVTVGVAEETPLPEGVSTTATVSFRAANGEEIQVETVVLSAMMSRETRVFRAPVTVGTYSVTVSSQVEETAALRVIGASAQVLVEPVAVQSTLTVSLQPGGMLTRMEHAVPTGVYFDGREDDGLRGASGIAVSGDLLFVTAVGDNALSAWRVNAEAGTLTQTDLHTGLIFGLRGAIDAAVSSDGTLLFVTADLDNALSVWRVNAEAGTLSQTVIYQNNRPDPNDASKTIDGLLRARGIAISDDLLFVTAESNNALSVWRVNAEAGSLTRTALYQNRRTPNRIEEVDGRFDGLLGPQDAVVSSDGALLFVTATEDDTLSVWRVNAEAGTLTQTALYQNRRDRRPSNRIEEVDGRFDGLFRPQEAALSSDGALLFVAASFGNALSVWRVNAEAGTLSQTVVYQNGMGGINGLGGATGVTVSGDLLFVTAPSNDALSVWRVNASSGTLSQTALYRDGTPGIDGLDDARYSAVSSDGDLLFVTATESDALSVWQINNAEVPFGVPVMIRVQSGMPVDREVTVTVTAQSGADSIAAQPVTLSSDMLSDDAIFPAGNLGPGRWIFTAQAKQANPPTELDTSAARIAMQVLPALLSLEPQQDRFALGSTVVLTVRTIAGLPDPASLTIDAVNTASGETTSTITVEYSAGATEQEVFFPAQAIAMFGLGQLDFFIRLPDNSPFRVGDGPAAIVQIVISQLGLAPLPELLALGSTVILTVRADPVALTEATYNIIARNLTSPSTFPISIAVMHPAGDTEREVSFSAQQIASPGQWEFSIQLPEGSPFQVNANRTAAVYVAPVLSLRLQGEAFFAGDSLTIEVQAESPPAMDTTVTITARRQQDGVEVDAEEAVTLSPAPEVLSGQAVFPAAALGAGEWVFTAQSEPPQALYTADARAEAAVLPRSLMLELSAPPSVTVGSTFPVTVGVAEETPLAGGVSVTATVSFRAADAEEIQAETAVLTAMMSSATPVFRAPVTAGVYTLAVSGEVEETAALPVTVTGASASVTVVPVAVMLRLNGPAEAVSVGQDYTVMVDTTVAVPAGTTLEVTVRAGTATALQKEVSLTETISRLPVSFTAPTRAGEVMVTATALAQTSSGSRQVAVSDAVTLTVGVSAQEVQLVLSEVPDLVAASSTFPVTVGTEPALPEGAKVMVTVSLAAFPSEPMTLTAGTPTASVIVMAPAAGGAATLSADGEEAADSTLELNVLAAEAVTVQVQLQVSLSLRLDAPPEVTARDSFEVTVFTEPEVPGGATVTVTVVFDGTDSSPVVLSAEMPSTAVILTAPRRIENNLALMTSSVVTVAEPNALRVVVADADASVNAVAQSVELTLMVSPQRVNIGEEIEVTVGVAPALLADTTLTVEVIADEESEEATLTDATPSRQVRFTAMEAGPLEVRAQILEVAPANLVTVENTPTQTVQVRADGTVDLTLDAPKSVTVGDTFAVTVGVNAETPLPESVSVTATVSFRAADGEEIQAETAVLNAMMSSATRVFRAPVTAGVYTVAVSGQVEETAALRVTVTGASASVTVVPVAVMLRLNGPAEAVSVGQDYRVTVDTVMPVPEDTTLEVTVRAGTDLQEVLLTAAIPSTQVFLTAPARAGEVMVTATALAQTSSGSRQVAVSDADELTVGVSARDVPLALSEVPVDLVAAESTFSVTVSAAPAVLAGTTVQVTVRLAAFSSESVLLTPGAPTASVLVTALAAGGSATLFATGEAAADSRLELNVLPAQAAVRVQVQVSLSLRLDAPEMVAVRDSFAVTVFSEPKVPAGATIAVTVAFAGSTQPAMLSADAPTATVDFMAPGTAGTFAVDATGTESVMNPDALQLTVNPASALVEVLPIVILQPGGMLTRMEHAVPTGVYFDGREDDGLRGASGIAVSGDLLFVTAVGDNALSAWRVNAEAGTLTQTDLHTGLIFGLRGAIDAAVSSDGTLLFVTADLDNTLSVWRVNAEAGTLSQTVIYQNNRPDPDDASKIIDGLQGARGIAISDDLLFVTAESDNALSVWRVNAEAGTLTQTALYQNRRTPNRIEEVDGRFNGLLGPQDAVISSDGALLFVTATEDDTLSVWRVNAEAGTLTQTALYQNRRDRRPSNRIEEVDGRFDGLFRPQEAALSSDGALLFVAASFGNALSVWRVNAEAGTLSQTVVYQNGMGGINGLRGATGVTVSGDLLFVTAPSNDALSVWRVNASSGTLSQTALYRDGTPGIDGLDDARYSAVSSDGDLLFVTATESDALSVWQINNAEVPFGVPVMIRVQSGMPVDREVTVTVTAQSGADSVAARPVTLSPSTLSANAIFPAGNLGPGRWIFTAQAQPPTALHTSAARIAMQVLPPLLSLEPQQDQFILGSTVVLTVRTIAGWPDSASFTIDAVNTASGETTSTITVEYSAGATEQEVFFPAQAIAMFGLGQLDFFIRLPDNSPFRVGDGPAATVQIVSPRLQLVPLPELLALGNTVTLTVRASAALQVAASYRIIARRIGLPIVPEVDFAVTHPAGSTEVTVLIPGQSLSTGQWEFSIQLPDGSPFQVGESVTAFISTPALSLQPGGMLARMEHAVLAEAYFNSPESPNLFGILQFAVSDDLLFVTSLLNFDEPLSVWRVNAEAGTLSQSVVYRNGGQDDSENTISGLNGATGIAVSGNLLFVVGFIDNALSVWRVNRASGTLGQTAVYRNGDRDDGGNQVSGLSGAVAVAVSGDLLFVTSADDDALSVWRVNESSGTLRQTAVYLDSVFDGLDRVLSMAVSDNLLFVTALDDNALSAWRINAEVGTLIRTDLHRDGVNNIDGLDGPRGVAVSGDLLFVASINGDALSAWRINAEAGTLRRAEVYRDGVSGVDGLGGMQSVAVSGDLLFAVAREQNGILSIWRINAEAQVGILRQTALHRDGVLLTNRQVGVSGDVLFANAESNAGTISVWHINNAGVPFGAPVIIRVQSDMPVAGEVMVTVTARNGAEMARDTVTLSPENLSAEARFAPGTLGIGRWVFTAQAQPPALLNTGAARIAMQVLAPVELTLNAPDSVTVGSTFPVTVGVAEETPLTESVSVNVTVSFRAVDGEQSQAETVVLTPARSSARATFTAPDTAGRYTVAVRGPGDIFLLLIGTTVQVTVEPVLALDVPSAPIYRRVMFPVRVRLLGGLLEDDGNVGVTVYLRNAVTGVVASTRAATLSTAASSMVLTFEAIPGETAITPYGLTTEDIDQTGLAPMTSLSLQSAPPATVFVTRINVDLSGNGVFDTNDVILIARGFLTENHTARIAGGFSRLDRDTFQIRLEELADFGDISGNGVLDIIDLIFLTRNTDITVSDLRERVMADNNPFAYLCGSPASDACEDISSPHQNITLPEGIRYEAIGEVLDSLRRVPQPPTLLSPSNP